MEHYVPAERNLDEPPDPEEGKIRSVEVERVHSYPGETNAKGCQQCGEPVDRHEPHIYATGWVRNSIGKASFRAVFCDGECWGYGRQQNETR